MGTARLHRLRLNVSRGAANVVRVDEFLPLESLDILSGPPLALECDEKTFQAAVVAFAEASGWLVFWAWPPYKSPPGYPDLTMIRGNRIVFAELKAISGYLKPHQRQVLKELSATGKVEVYVWMTVDWDELVGVLS